MVDLVPTAFGDHLVRIHREVAVQGAVFDLPCRNWFLPDPLGMDLSVRFHGLGAGNPVGPAAGPHGQMAQNLLLSYLAGGRIIELKTVQVNDQLTIPRPCIDAANVCYNVEWSQELRLAESLHEYVSGAMLVHVVRQGGFFDGVEMAGPLGDVIWDMSVGYDLAGIQSPTMRRFLASMLDATELVDRLRLQIPAELRHLRDLDYPTRLSNSITLSTFHGCPASDIERICEHLIDEYGVNIIVKMNPPMLGRDRLEHLLHDVMGYDDIRVHEPAYTSCLLFDESIDIVRRLDARARSKGLRCGAKFSNTLEVVNHRDVFPSGNEVMYLSGQPLFVITSALTADFREAIGSDIPISFSAGIDQKNFADMVACGIKPVTTCTDLLRPGGYGRLPKYLHNLCADMERLNAQTIDEYVLARCDDVSITDVGQAGLHNMRRVAEAAAGDVRYRREKNNAAPRRINSHLVIFDCITCDKCIPVCPNDANFTYPLAEQRFEYRDLRVDSDGAMELTGEVRTFVTAKSMQIANFADYCNECGNCDTFCPEYGGPFIEKPTFFSSLEQFELHADHDGFYAGCLDGADVIHGRIKGRTYQLRVDRVRGGFVFHDSAATVTFDANHRAIGCSLHKSADGPYTIDMQVYHTLRLLLAGVFDRSRVNPVNAVVPLQETA